MFCGNTESADLRARIAKSLPSALWQGWAEKCDRTSGTEDGESAPKNHRTFAIEGEYNTAISVVARIRFAVAFIVQTRQRPPEHCSLPSSAWPLAENILRRNRHERWENTLAHASKPNAFSSRTDLPTCMLAVSEGRTLESWTAGEHR